MTNDQEKNTSTRPQFGEIGYIPVGYNPTDIVFSRNQRKHAARKARTAAKLTAGLTSFTPKDTCPSLPKS